MSDRVVGGSTMRARATPERAMNTSEASLPVEHAEAEAEMRRRHCPTMVRSNDTIYLLDTSVSFSYQ